MVNQLLTEMDGVEGREVRQRRFCFWSEGLLVRILHRLNLLPKFSHDSQIFKFQYASPRFHLQDYKSKTFVFEHTSK